MTDGSERRLTACIPDSRWGALQAGYVSLDRGGDCGLHSDRVSYDTVQLVDTR